MTGHRIKELIAMAVEAAVIDGEARASANKDIRDYRNGVLIAKLTIIRDMAAEAIPHVVEKVKETPPALFQED